jgi:hypothetical protein
MEKIKKIHPLDGHYLKIEGMGGVVSFPAAVIHAALELAGFEVDMHNNDGREGKPENNAWYQDKEKYKNYITGKEPWPDSMVRLQQKSKKTIVQIDVKHLPWGG